MASISSVSASALLIALALAAPVAALEAVDAFQESIDRLPEPDEVESRVETAVAACAERVNGNCTGAAQDVVTPVAHASRPAVSYTTETAVETVVWGVNVIFWASSVENVMRVLKWYFGWMPVVGDLFGE